MKLKLFCILMIALLLLAGCDGGTPQETDPADETTTEASLATVGTSAPETDATEAPADPERIVLPKPYIDIEFDEAGTAFDRMGRVSCEIVNASLGNVAVGGLQFDGASYEVPHFCVSGAGGVLRLTYNELDNMYDLYEDLMGGFAMEAFLVNYSETSSSSAEQCMISSTQSGGYNFTVLQGKYAASVHTDGSYRNAILSEDYSTTELTHLLSVYDPNSETLALYVNGECVDTVEAPGLIGLASGECYRTVVIGGDINGSGGTNLHSESLAVADFKLYRMSLDETQAKAVYARAVSVLTGEESEAEILEGDSEVNVSDTLFENLFDSFVTDIYQPVTALENPPTVLSFADASTALLGGEEVRPATVLFEASVKDGVLYAASKDGESLGTMFDAVSALDKKIIPAFRVSDSEAGRAVVEFINENYIGDCFVIASDIMLLKETADSTFAARPLLDCTDRTSIDAEKLFLECAKAGVKTVLLASEVLDPALVTALRARSVAVVAVLDEGADVAEIHTAVHTAVSGILTDDFGAVLEYYGTVTDRTLCITPLIVAHRGDPEHHPDNMLRSLISAAKSGATSIELDIWMTKDGHIVLNHDNVTTNFSETLKCNDATRAELKALTYQGPHAQAGDEIAFLDEVFAVFSTEYTDKILTIEVKDAREVVIDKTIVLAEEYGMTGRILLIGMKHLVSNYTYEQYGLGAQMNQSYLVKKANPALSLKLGVLESTILHSSCFTKHSEEHPDFIAGIYHRLIKYSTWTSSSLSSTLKNYLCGVPEYTTNYPHAVDDFYRYLTLSVDDSGKVKVMAMTYAGEEINVTGSAELVVLTGEGSFSGGKIKGSGAFCFRVKCSVPNVDGSEYYLYTNAVTQ